jgi:hypothetical protein
MTNKSFVLKIYPKSYVYKHIYQHPEPGFEYWICDDKNHPRILGVGVTPKEAWKNSVEWLEQLTLTVFES